MEEWRSDEVRRTVNLVTEVVCQGRGPAEQTSGRNWEGPTRSLRAIRQRRADGREEPQRGSPGTGEESPPRPIKKVMRTVDRLVD